MSKQTRKQVAPELLHADNSLKKMELHKLHKRFPATKESNAPALKEAKALAQSIASMQHIKPRN